VRKERNNLKCDGKACCNILHAMCWPKMTFKKGNGKFPSKTGSPRMRKEHRRNNRCTHTNSPNVNLEQTNTKLTNTKLKSVLQLNTIEFGHDNKILYNWTRHSLVTGRRNSVFLVFTSTYRTRPWVSR